MTDDDILFNLPSGSKTDILVSYNVLNWHIEHLNALIRNPDTDIWTPNDNSHKQMAWVNNFSPSQSLLDAFIVVNHLSSHYPFYIYISRPHQKKAWVGFINPKTHIKYHELTPIQDIPLSICRTALRLIYDTRKEFIHENLNIS